MKFTKIALAAAALVSAPAFALTPAQAVGATQLWVTGASAPTNAVFQGVMTLCAGMSYRDATGTLRTNPGTLNVHTYLEGTGAEPGKSSGERMAYACEVQTHDARAGDLENTNIVVYHTVEGGSFNAYTPALALVGETSSFMPVTLSRTAEVTDLAAVGRCAAGTGTAMALTVSGVVNNAGPGTGIVRYNNCTAAASSMTTVTLATGAVSIAGDTAPVTSIGGFSDTEYVINKLNLNVATDVGAIGSTAKTNIGQAFGVGVSYPLYYKLQQNDIASGSLAATCDDAPFTATAPNLTLACQPNLPSSRYTTAANSTTVGGVNGALFGGVATEVVRLARRAPTSGTQSASNIRFLNVPCAAGDAGGALVPARTADSTSTLIINENSGTGNVKTTLNTATGAGEYALGVVSMENTPAPTATADRWAFVKLDGVSPNSDSFHRANAIDGSYSFWYELEMFTAASAAGTPGETLLAQINNAMGNPEVTNLKGLFLTPLSGAVAANVGKTFRDGNSCAPAVQ